MDKQQNFEIDDMSVQELNLISKKVRLNIIRSIANAGAGHPGGSLSATEILVCLYFKIMNTDPNDPLNEDRDRFILSKGHASIALYSVLAEKGFFPVDELNTFDHVDSRLQGHPDMTKTPGVDMSCGSLGQGLSVGIGMALAAKYQKRKSHIYVLLGDGELQEGQVWEAIMTADRFHLDNITVIIDINRQQLLGQIEEIFPYSGSLKLRWESFGWNVLEVNGHDIALLDEKIHLARTFENKPTVIFAYTTKGKGVSFMENNPSWHSKGISQIELEIAEKEIINGEAFL